MSYTKQTWTTGDTVTASKLNHIEDGIAGAGSVATVCVNFNGGGISGTVGCNIGYAQYTNGTYSIETPLWEHYGYTPKARFYVPVCLPPSDDDFKAYIFFSEFIDNVAGYTITGDISSNKIEAHERAGASSWASQPWYGFEVNGDGQIDVYYND